MRIVQMIDTLNWGGAQKMQLFQAHMLCPMGIESTVISLKKAPNSTLPADLLAAGASVITFPFPRLFSPGSFIRLVNYLRKQRFDLIHAHLAYANIIGSFAGYLSGTPVIASLRSAGYNPRYHRARRLFMENLAMRYFADRVMANGYTVAEYGRERLGGREIDVLPNAVDLIDPLSDRERRGIREEIVGDANRPLILSVGRLTLPKGFPDLLQAFALVREHFPQAALAIAGGGTLTEQLKSQIEDLGLEGDAFLLGLRNDVPRLLAAGDIYANASHWEGTPVSVMEAMAAGLPVLATAVGDTPRILASGTGVLVEPNNPQGLAEGIIQLLEDPVKRRRLGEAARMRIVRNYSREIWRENVLNLYARVTPAAGSYLNKLHAGCVGA